MKLINPNETLAFNEDLMAIKAEQELGSQFWNDLDEAKTDFQMRLNGLTPVASIPSAVVNQWVREGFDFWHASAAEIQKKLRKEDRKRFLVTDKNF